MIQITCNLVVNKKANASYFACSLYILYSQKFQLVAGEIAEMKIANNNTHSPP